MMKKPLTNREAIEELEKLLIKAYQIHNASRLPISFSQEIEESIQQAKEFLHR